MSTRTKDRDITPWITRTDEPPHPDWDEATRAAIAEGLADAKAGRVTPAEEVWKELGIE